MGYGSGAEKLKQSDAQRRGEVRRDEALEIIQAIAPALDDMSDKDKYFVESCILNEKLYGIHWRVSQSMLEWLQDIEARVR